jgi:hypothetical protein
MTRRASDKVKTVRHYSITRNSLQSEETATAWNLWAVYSIHEADHLGEFTSRKAAEEAAGKHAREANV